jgi:hypothetical protein
MVRRNTQGSEVRRSSRNRPVISKSRRLIRVIKQHHPIDKVENLPPVFSYKQDDDGEQDMTQWRRGRCIRMSSL